MKLVTFASALLFASVASLSAHTFSLSSVNGGAATGSTKINFDSLALGGGAQVVNSDLSVSFTGSYTGVVQGAASGKYARPFLSGTNGVGFGAGGSNQANGADETKYLSVGQNGTATLTFNSQLNYLGLLWGSVDNYNWIEFYNGVNKVGSFTGSQIWANANGNQGAQGTFYVNFTDLSGTFDRVVAKSSGYAFEFDNVAYNKAKVPDAGSTLALAGGALLGLGLLRRRR